MLKNVSLNFQDYSDHLISNIKFLNYSVKVIKLASKNCKVSAVKNILRGPLDVKFSNSFPYFPVFQNISLYSITLVSFGFLLQFLKLAEFPLFLLQEGWDLRLEVDRFLTSSTSIQLFPLFVSFSQFNRSKVS